MRYIAYTMALGVAMLFGAYHVSAQKQYPDGSQAFPPGQVCMTPEVAIKSGAERYGERPLMEWSFGGIKHVIFWNAENESWTIFARVPNEKKEYLLCVVSTGHKMRPTSISRLVNGDPA